MPKQGRIYKWRPGATFKVEAQVAGEYLEDLREDSGGALTTTAVYEAAMDPDSPLHEEFEWDVEKAAQAHWRDRAGNLIRHLAVVRVKNQKASSGIPAFMSVNVTSGQRGYVNAEQVYSSADYHHQVVDQVLKQLKGLQERYGKLEELDEIWSAIEKTEEARAKKKAA